MAIQDTETTIVTEARPEATAEPESETPEATVEEEEDFNPLGARMEGWSAFECTSGPFTGRG